MESTVCKLTEKTLVPLATNKTDTFNIVTFYTQRILTVCVKKSCHYTQW